MKQLIITTLLSLICLIVRAQQISYSNIDEALNFEAYTSSISEDSLELNIVVKFKSNILVPRSNLHLSFGEEEEKISTIFRNTCIQLDCKNSEFYEDVHKDTTEFYRLVIPKKNKNYTYFFDFSYISKSSNNYSTLHQKFEKVPDVMKRSIGLEKKDLITMPVEVETKLVSSVSGSITVGRN